MHKEAGEDAKRISSLDGWRGLAILLVLIDHAGEGAASGLVHKMTRVGATGVGLFFALSGFLITSLLLREQAKKGHIDLKAFYIRRSFRILPPVLTYLLFLTLIGYVSSLHVTKLQVLSCIFLFRNYLGGDWGVGWYTSHFWSLTVEEHFYLIWPALLILTRKNLKVLISLALTVAAWRAISLHYHLLAGPWAPGRTDIRIDSLLWGCILAIALDRDETRGWLSKWLTMPVMAILVGVDVVSNVRHGQHDYSWFEPIVLALLLVWPILRRQGWLHMALEFKPLVMRGKISYSLYIWQQFWLLYPGSPKAWPWLQRFPVSLVAIFVCGAASYHLIEKPFIGLGRKLLRSLERRSSPVAV